VHSLDIWETEYLQVLEGQDPVLEWVKGTGLRPILNGLDDQERQQVQQMQAGVRQMTADQLTQALARFEQMAGQAAPENKDMVEVVLKMIRDRLAEPEKR
jgi:hypothetical protein